LAKYLGEGTSRKEEAEEKSSAFSFVLKNHCYRQLAYTRAHRRAHHKGHRGTQGTNAQGKPSSWQKHRLRRRRALRSTAYATNSGCSRAQCGASGREHLRRHGEPVAV